MSRQTLILLLLLFAVGGIYAGARLSPRPADTSVLPQAVLAPRFGEVGWPDPLAWLHETYRLGPDRRILLAIGDVHELLTGAQPGDVTANFLSGSWHYLVDGTQVITLVQYADFPEVMVELERWAGRLIKEGRIAVTSDAPDIEAAQAIEQFFPVHTIAALRRLEAQWRGNGLSASALRQALQAYALLSFQALDRVGASDPLHGRSLAVLAIARAAGSSDPAAECFIAEALGYYAHADRIAAALPERDPLRLFLTRQDELLAAMAAEEGARPETIYLSLLRLAESGQEDAWTRLVTTRVPDSGAATLPVLCTAKMFGMFELTVPVAGGLMRTALDELGQLHDRDRTGLSLNDLMREDVVQARAGESFEAALDVATRSMPGPLVPGRVVAAFYRGIGYSGVDLLGRHYLKALSSSAAADALSRVLGSAESGVQADFALWYRHLANMLAGQPALRDMGSDIRLLRFQGHMGTPLLLVSLAELYTRAPYGSSEILMAARNIVTRLDERPEYRGAFATIAQYYLLDVPLAERLHAAAFQVQGLRYPKAGMYAHLRGDNALLTRLATDRQVSLSGRVDALRHLAKDPRADADFIHAGYSQLMQEHPDNWVDLSQTYLKYLRAKKDHQRARDFLTAWLSQEHSSSSFPEIYARSSLAKTDLLEERYVNGLGVIWPVVHSQQFGTMETTARLLNALGLTSEAYAMATQAFERYPDSLHAVALVAGLFWRNARHDEAALALRSFRYPITGDWKTVIGDEFMAAFAGRDVDAVEAARTMITHGVAAKDMITLSDVIGHRGNNPELAFQIASRITEQGRAPAEGLVRAYGFLKAARGKEKALDWIRLRLPEADALMLAAAAYELKEDEVLWELMLDPNSLDEPHRSYIWLMRAAAAAHGAPDDPSRVILTQHFEQEGEGPFQLLGRYVLGLTPESAIMGNAPMAWQQCKIAYYIGVRHEAARQLEAASSWYRIAVETRVDIAEATWAFNKLFVWSGKNRSLSFLDDEEASRENGGIPPGSD